MNAPTKQYTRQVCSWLLLLFVFAFFVMHSGCGFHNDLPQHRNQVEIKRDSAGRIVYKKFDQLMKISDSRYVVTVIQKLDTLGRLISEVGTDHPYLGKQYLYKIHYGDKLRVSNRFRWSKYDSSELETASASAFDEEIILIDTATYVKQITVSKISANKTEFIGSILETFPTANMKTYKDIPFRIYRFRLPMHSFSFDEQTRLRLEYATILRD